MSPSDSVYGGDLFEGRMPVCLKSIKAEKEDDELVIKIAFTGVPIPPTPVQAKKPLAEAQSLLRAILNGPYRSGCPEIVIDMLLSVNRNLLLYLTPPT